MKRSQLFLTLAILTFLSSGCELAKSKGVVKENYIHKYGIPMSKKEWNNRGKNGTAISKMENGVTISKTYENGVLHGTKDITFPHSEIVEKKETYEHGLLKNRVLHYSSGVPMWKEKLLKDGKSVITTWYEDGSPQSIEKYEKSLLKSGEYFTLHNEIESHVKQNEGTRIQRDAFGNLLSRDLIKDGKMALRTTFHPNGDPKTIASYENGFPHGQKKTFWIGGQPNTIEEWFEGKQHGKTIVFQNGEKRAEIPYVNGEKHGIEYRYRDENILVEEVQWERNQKHGPSKIYVDDVATVKWFHQGKPVSKFIFDEYIR